VVVLDRDVALAEKVLATLKGTKGGHQAAFIDVLDKAAVQQAADKVIKELGKNRRTDQWCRWQQSQGHTNPSNHSSTFRRSHPVRVDPEPAGTILPSQAFGRCMVKQKEA